jgi:O-antigen/teichoic acid export membrane protein
MSDNPGFRRAMLAMTASSLLVPAVGLLTAPILTQALGVAGRGEAAAAVAPNSLVVSVATLGLPEALTYFLAKRPQLTRRAVLTASAFSAILGAACLVLLFFVSGFLAAGDSDLADLILLGVALALPMLLVNLLRGAASGRQLWGSIAAERILNSLLRLAALLTLAVAGELTVFHAVLVMTIAPIVAGVAYWRLLLPPPRPATMLPPVPLARSLLSYGGQIWLGAVASMLLGRLSQLLVTPLSDVRQLGLLVVAITISDVPFIVATAVRDVVFGADSAAADPRRLAATSRVATLVALLGSLAMAATLPLWVAPLFGSGFDEAIVPTWLLLGSAVVAVPGLIAGAGLGAAGRPSLRSAALVLALITNLAAMVLLVPPYGALGAAISGLISTLASTVFGVLLTARVLELPTRTLFLPTRADLAMLWKELTALLRRLGGR